MHGKAAKFVRRHRNSGFTQGNVVMTTNGTAAAWRATLPVPLAVTSIILSLALAGCESGAGLLSGANQPPVAVADPAATAKTVSVAVAPVLGVPEAASKQMVEKLANGLDKSRFSIVTTASTPADYTLRGYATAAKDGKDAKSASKLSYFFDVMDKSGKKVNRIAGEEVLAAAPAGKDVWQAVTPEVTQTIATKTAASFASSIPSNPANSADPAIASAAPLPPSAAGAASAVKAAAAPADTAANQTTAAVARTAGPTTGSIDKPAGVTAVVPNVTGAPGDGSQALSAALQKELTKNGVALGDGAAGGQSYRVEGKVTVGADKEGKQPIEISWNVKDPQGKKLGTVTQKNEIPQGSLDGAWGKTADAAAAAAAQGIIKLLPAKSAQASAQ